MKTYARELKQRREAAGLTTRRLGDRIDRSSSFVTDFELARKSNPPEPEMMRRLADALNWPVADQLRAWGYPVETGPVTLENPFDRNDIRWRVVEAMRALDLTGPDRGFWLSHFALELRMYQDIAAGFLDDLQELDRSDHVDPIDTDRSGVA